MSDFLFGSMQSGSPTETRGATADIGQMFQDMLAGREGPYAGTQWGNMMQQAMQNLTGMSPEGIGLEAAAGRFFGDPTQRIQQGAGDMWASTQDKWRSGKADILEGMSGFGGATGTSSTGNLANAYGTMLNQHNLDVGNLINQVYGQQGAALAPIMQAFTQAGLGNQGQMLNFLAPGAPVHQPGAIGEIVKLGTAVAGAMTGNPGLMAAGAGMGDTTSSINNLNSGLNFDRNLFDGVRLSDYGQFKRGS